MAQSNNIPSRLTPQSANWPDSLSHPASGDIGISITKCDNYGLVNLRCAPQDSGLLENLFGCRAPSQPNQFSSAGQRLAVWLGPDETLLMLDDRDEAKYPRQARIWASAYLPLATVTDGFAISGLRLRHAPCCPREFRLICIRRHSAPACVFSHYYRMRQLPACVWQMIALCLSAALAFQTIWKAG